MTKHLSTGELSRRSASSRLRWFERRRHRQLLLEQLEERRLLVADWRNPDLPPDVSGDGRVGPRDALLLVNAFHRWTGAGAISRVLPANPVFGTQQPPFYDVSGDGRLSAADLHLVFSTLQRRTSSLHMAAEAEGSEVQAMGAASFPIGSGWNILAGLTGEPDCAPSTPVSDWIFRESGGTEAGKGIAALSERRIVLREGNSHLVAAEQTFVVPDEPGPLSFTYFDLTFDTTDNFIRDAFEAALVDENGQIVVYPFATGREAYFNVTEGQSPALGSQATFAGQTVTLDTSGLTPGATARLILRLVNNDSDTLTTVSIENIQLPGKVDCLPLVAIALEEDTAPPGDAGLPYAGDLLTNNPAIVGLASDDSAIAKLEARIDGGPLVDITSALAGGQFRFDPGPLAPGSHILEVIGTDDGNQSSSAALEFIVNSPPVLNPGGDRTVTEGTLVTFDGSGSSDAEAPIHAYRWLFPDGAVFDGPIATRTYVQDGIFSATLEVTDTAGSVVSQEVSITVLNSAPVVDPWAPLAGLEGNSVSLRATFSDAGILDVHQAVVDWGDGTMSPASLAEFLGHGQVMASHIYADNGIYTIRLEVMDDGQEVGAVEVIAAIDNVPPLVTAAGDQAIAEGSALTLEVAAFSDPGFIGIAAGTSETFSATIDWGDGAPVEAGTVSFTPGNPGVFSQGTVHGQHTYLDDGLYSVTVTVMDDDGGQSSDAFQVQVNNSLPQLNPGQPISASEGSSATWTTTFADAGILDTHSAVIYWGDGTQSDATVSGSAGQGIITAQHHYADNGNYPIRVELRDDDGGVATGDSSATIANVAPTLLAGLSFEPRTTVIGQQLATVLSGRFTDPGFDRPSAGTVERFTTTIDWGDGIVEPVPATVEQGTDGTLTAGSFAAGHHYALGGIFTVTATVTDDDGGSASQSFQFGAARIDVIPRINLTSGGDIPVEIFRDPGFDPAQLDPASLRFGPGGAVEDHGQIHGTGANGVITHFRTQAADIRPTDTVAFLTGTLSGGTPFVGMDTIEIVPGHGFLPPVTSPAGPTKFFVVDAAADASFRYDPAGNPLGSFAVHAARDPRGIAANAAGDTLWIIDGQSHQVIVQGPDGSVRGSWLAHGLSNPQDIATDGRDLWIVDAASGQVLRYVGAAALTAGSALPSSAFSLDAANASPSGLVTDGQRLWVTDDVRDEVFVYSLAGSLLGRWQLDPLNADASGITLNPAGGDDLWVVDRGDDAVYHYAAATPLLAGSLSAAGTFLLAGENQQPEGIADPPPPGGPIELIDFLPSDIRLSFDELLSGTVLGDRYRASGVTFDNARVQAGPFPISRPNVIRSTTADAIAVRFLYGAHRAGIQIDTDGFNSDRQPQLRAYDVRGSLLGAQNFVQGPDFAGFEFPGKLIGTLLLGSIPTASPDQFLFSDAYDNLIFHAAAPLELSIESPSQQAQLSSSETVLVSGNVRGGQVAAVTFNGVPAEAIDGGGAFFNRVTIGPGANEFAIQATDIHGRTTSTTLILNGVQRNPGSIDFSLASDLSASFAADYGRTTLDEESRELSVELAIRNAGDYAADVPLLVGITNLSDPAVRVRDADGITPEGMPYFDFSQLVADGTLSPGEATDARTISFFNPAGIRFTYDLVFFGRLNQPPEITTVPHVEALAGRSYAYDVDAADPDSDALTFSLLSGPAGATIDSASGILSWTPSAADLGTHAIAIRASDNRGGTSDQRYTLSVITPPPNRPPVFTSVPVVSAEVGADYEYDADATDPDSDGLTFSLLSGPGGMTVDPSTGLLDWEPASQQVGQHPISLRITDGHGGSAEQQFTIVVEQAEGNHPPVIISEPVTNAVVGEEYRYNVDALDADDDSLTYSLAESPSGMTIDPATGLITWSSVDGLISRWSGEGNANDSRDGNHGTLEGGATITPGRVGQAFTFDGLNDHVLVPHAENLEPTHVTVAAWVRGTSQGTFRYIVTKSTPTFGGSPYALYTGTNGGLTFYIHDDITNVGSPPASSSIWDGNWHHVVGTFDLNHVRLYVDGVEIGSGTPTTRAIDYEFVDAGRDLVIGNYLGLPGSYGFTGQIDELSVYNRALRAAEIQDLLRGVNPQSPFPVTVRVDDGRGGIDKQSLTIEVVENRPPEIVSEPVTDAFIHDVTPSVPTTYSGIVFPQGELSFADRVVSFTPGLNSRPPYNNASLSLGPPDTATVGVDTALGQGGVLVLEFVDNLLVDQNAAQGGLDLFVFETGAVEAFRLEISSDLSHWINLGVVQGQPTGIDIKPFISPGQAFRYVRLTDVLPNINVSTPFGEADIDAVGAIGAIPADSAYKYDVEAIDPDNDPLTYSLTQSPAGMGIDPATGLISWTPPAFGSINEFSVPTANSRPNGIAAGPDGNVWFIERAANKIGKMAPTGAVLAEYALPAAIANTATGITAGPDGNMWFVSYEHAGKITPDGTITVYPLPSQSAAHFIATGPDGNLWIPEYGNNRIGRLTPAGVYTRFSIPTANSLPTAIVAGADGNLWFTELQGHKIGRITPAGVITEFPTPTANSAPEGITLGPDGNVWFVEAVGKVGRITPAGVITEFAIPQPSGKPYTIAAGSDGNLWFDAVGGTSDTGADYIGRITTAGAITLFPVKSFARSSWDDYAHTTSGPDGNIWFTRLLDNTISRLNIADSAEVTVEVNDGRGGVDTQSFTIDVHNAAPGEIRGTKFNDLDGDGHQDGNNFIRNNDFESGSVDFLSDLTQSTNLQPAGVFIIGRNPSTYHSSWASFGDHTTVSGLMMIINGAVSSNHVVWAQSIEVQPNSEYRFGLWAASSFSSNPARIQFFVNGEMIGTDLQLTSTVGQWQFLSATWQSSSETTATVSIHNFVPAFGGNDFVIDDISFVTTDPAEPSLKGWTIFLDDNRNGNRDPAERFTTTDASGNYSFPNLAPGTYLVAEEQQPGWQQTAPTSHSYEITVGSGQVITGIDFGNRQTNEPPVEQPNRSPQFTNTPPDSATIGQLFRYDAAASDADGDALTFDLVVRPAGMAIDAARGIVVWVPTAEQEGTQEVTLRVADGRGGVALQSFAVTTSLANSTPAITSVPKGPAVVALPWQYQVAAQDADGDAIGFELVEAPAGMTIDAASGLVTWTPSAGQVGTHHVAVRASDGRGASTTQSFDLPVVATAPNDPPTITSSPRGRVRIDDVYLYQALASDPNGDPLTYSLPTFPAGMTIDAAGLVSWQPTAEQLGSHQVQVRVDDGRGSFATQTYSISVVTQTSNQPPSITSTPPQAATVGRQYAYDAAGIDPDGDPLTWSLDTAPAGMSIDPARGTIRWTPTSDQTGEQSVVVRVTDTQGGWGTQSFSIVTRAVNLPPAISSTPPTTAVASRLYTYAVRATDPESDPLAFSLTAAPTGMSIDAASGLISWTPTAAQLGSFTVNLRVADGQGGVATQSYTLVVSATATNQPPVITSSPSLTGTVGEVYAYSVTATDPEGQAILFSLLTAPAGMSISPTTGLISWTPVIDQVGLASVTVAAIDPQGNGGTQSFTIGVADDNSPPQITSTPKQVVTAGLAYRYDVRATDPDGDALTFRLDSAPAGMTIDQLGRVTWSPQIASIGTHSIAVTVEDPRGASQTQTYDLVVAPDGQTPRVNLLVSANPVLVGSPVTFVATATDNVGVASLVLTINGNPVPLDANGRITLRAEPAGSYEIRAAASDVAGNTGLATTTLLVIDTSDTDPPDVEITLPADGATITAPVDVIGTASDSGLTSYQMEACPSSGGSCTLLFAGTTSVVGGVLGKFDPSSLANDTYLLRLSAEDVGGNVSTIEQTVHVAGNLKIGNFTLSFTDLTVPVSGIPISVSRTYDTLQAGQQDELGFGWRLEFRDTDLRTSVQPTSDFEQEIGIFTPYHQGARVYVTLPGGRREGFSFMPRRTSGFGGIFFFEPQFVADAGVTSRLSVAPATLIQSTSDGLFYGANSLAYNPADRLNFGGEFYLTTKEGLAYVIDAASGDLTVMSDGSGNRLTFTDAAITSNRGPRVTFQRDPQGRIVGVTDPLGNQVRYAYDSRGDLVRVTDRDGNETQFVYGEPARPHYLTEVIDPLGRSGVRTEYDDSGRLIRLIDADGNPVRLVHDPDNFLETVIDALGRPTTFEYDLAGNVVTEVDALGGITRRTYDGANILLTETDPLGNITRFSYDGDGNVLTETDPLGNVTRFTYQTVTPGFFDRVRGARPVSLLASSTDPLGNAAVNTYAGVNLISTRDAGGNVTSFTYDAAGNQTSITDAAGGITRFEYDAAGNLTRQIDALGSATEFTYDAAGNQLTETRTLTTPAGIRTLVTTTDYDASGRPIAVTDAEGHTTRTEYDELGNQSASIDALLRRTEFVYDDRGQLIETRFADGTTSTTEYDAAGRRIASTGRGGETTRFEYDALGRLTATIFPDETPLDLADNPRSRTEYDKAGRVTAQTDERANRTEFEYDLAGRQTLVRDALSHEMTTEYDAAGRSIAVTDALARTTQFVYDALGRQVETQFADGTTRKTLYDPLGRVIAETDQAGRVTQFEYDSLGRLTAVVDALDQRTEYGYDEAGNLVTQKDANSHVTRYEYDGLGRRIATVLPLSQRSSTDYDAVGNVAAATDFNGDTSEYEYDDNNRLLARLFPDGTSVSFTYTPGGQRETYVDARGTSVWEYDERDRLVRRTDPDGTAIEYAYDAAGNRTSVTTLAGSIEYAFDALNRLASVLDPAGGLTEYTYDAAGQLVRTDLPNGTWETRQYDAAGRLELLENRSLAEVISSYRYTLSPTGRRDAVLEEGGRRVDYFYDDLDRLTGEQITDAILGNRSIGYTYDPVGNRLIRTDSVEGTTGYTYDANDRLLTETLGGSTTNYTYDDNGNTLSREASSVDRVFYEWDFENRLTAAEVTDAAGTRQIDYAYDADGIRAGSTVAGEETRYLIDTSHPFQQVVVEYTPGGILEASYVHGLDLISQTRPATGQSFYHVDGLGSTRALTNALAQVTDRYLYDAFGRTIGQVGSTANVYLFAGEQRDFNVGLDYLRARYLSSMTGRFFGMDSFQGFRPQPISLHRFLYANANAVNMIDPSGEFSIVIATFVALVNMNENHRRYMEGKVAFSLTQVPRAPIAMGQLLESSFPDVRMGRTLTRGAVTQSGSPSLHALGLAVDVAIDSTNTRQRIIGDSVFGVLIDHAHELKLHEVIWNEEIWSVSGGGPRPFPNTLVPGRDNAHKFHIHIGFLKEGSHRTRFPELSEDFERIRNQVDDFFFDFV